jgi:sortase (surface protein transpeptidase)
VTSRNGNITYRVEWARWVSPGEDFTGYVARNGTESITLVTCVGSFSAGHYSNRLVVRGVRI